MKLHPVPENQALPNVKQIYTELKSALELNSVPLFFQFLGAFPNYLIFLRETLINNLESSKFAQLIDKNTLFVQEVFRDNFPKKDLLNSFLGRYQETPEFLNLRQELLHIFKTNAKLVFIFLALREAVKGWAVAARKLASRYDSVSTPHPRLDFDAKLKEQLIYATDLIKNQAALKTKEQSITKRATGIETAILPRYLELCELEFGELLKSKSFLYFRVELEKITLRNLDLLPVPIFSPINVVLKLTKTYPDFPDLLYLLSEHFPTYAVQRYLFSAYIIY